MRTNGTHAFAIVDVLNVNHQPVQMMLGDGMGDASAEGLLQMRGGRWRVLGVGVGSSDVWWCGHDGVPAEVAVCEW